MTSRLVKLQLLSRTEYRGVDNNDPIRFYFFPVFGQLYRRRVELCLSECQGGERVLEVGFGTGLSFLNLNEMYEEIHGVDLSANVAQVAEVFTSRGIEPQLKNGNVLDLPYEDNFFNTVLLISILEHLKPDELDLAFKEIQRVLKPGGQVVYGVPVERPFMVLMFRLLGYDIRQHHFSTEKQVSTSARKYFLEERIVDMPGPLFTGNVYQVGHFIHRENESNRHG